VQRWYRLKKAFPLAERPRPDGSLTFRVAVFSAYSIGVGAASFMMLAGVESAAPYLIQASRVFSSCLPGTAIGADDDAQCPSRRS
jgi:hypothetical protein